MPKQGYMNTIENGATAGTFTGTIKEGNSDIPFTNQTFVDNSNNPIININELGFDSYIDFDEVGGEATDCKACVQVKIIGDLNRPNTSAQIKNLVNAIKKETGSRIGVVIEKG